MANRKRDHVIKVSMTAEELSKFKRRLAESGKKSNQSFGLEALLDSKITSQEVITNLQELNKTFAKQQLNERNIGTNINQIAKIANATGEIDTAKLEASLLDLDKIKEARMREWEYLRSYLQELRTRA